MTDLDVKELDRKVKEHIAHKPSIVGFSSAVSMASFRELMCAQFKAATGEPDPSGKLDSTAEQSKTSDQIDFERLMSMWDGHRAKIACLMGSSAEAMTPAKLKEKLDALSSLGRTLLVALAIDKCREKERFPKKIVEDVSRIDICKEYRFWYTEALAVIKRVLPSSLADFIGFYKYPRKRAKLTHLNLRIADALCGLTLLEEIPLGHGKSAVHSVTRVLSLSDCFCMIKAQCDILEAANESFTSSLHKIQQVAQAELLDAELSAARKLNENGSACAAGAIAGVVLEKYLNAVIGSYEFTMSKKTPGINDCAKKLKCKGVIDVQTCWSLQSLGNLRDLCYDAKSEPTKEDVEEMINGVDRIINTLF